MTFQRKSLEEPEDILKKRRDTETTEIAKAKSDCHECPRTGRAGPLDFWRCGRQGGAPQPLPGAARALCFRDRGRTVAEATASGKDWERQCK